VRPPTQIVESRAVVGGFATRTLAVDGDGPPILLLHGFSDSADTWRPLLAELAARGRRAVAVDMPGAGRADALPRRIPIFTTLNGFTEAFVRDYARGDKAILGGNSLGGFLSLRAGERGDGPLMAIAPMSPAGIAYHPRFLRFSEMTRALVPLLRVAYRAPVPPRLVRRSAAAMYARRLGGRATDPSLAWRYASHIKNMHDVRRLGRIARTLAEESRRNPLNFEDISVPVLLIWGRNDELCDFRGAESFLETVPDSRLVVVEGGHCPQVERPAEIAELLVDVRATIAAR
jgi:pimeloyl-ACP methyl ester carboxylesterase